MAIINNFGRRQTREYGEFGPQITMDVYEGNATMNAINDSDGDIVGPAIAAPLKKGDWVTLTSAHDNDGFTVKKAVGTDTTIIGKLAVNPKYIYGAPTGAQGTVLTEGTYQPRQVTVDVMGTRVTEVTVKNAEASVVDLKPGDFLEVDTGNTAGLSFKKVASGKSKCLVLEKRTVPATGESKVWVLFNYYG